MFHVRKTSCLREHADTAALECGSDHTVITTAGDLKLPSCFKQHCYVIDGF